MLEQLEDRTTPSSISGLSPASAPRPATARCEIYGSGFTGATSVTFGGVATFGVMVMSDTTICVQAPAHAAGDRRCRGDGPQRRVAHYLGRPVHLRRPGGPGRDERQPQHRLDGRRHR